MLTALIAGVGSVLITRQLVHATETPGIDFVHVWRATHHLLHGSGAYGDPLFTYPPGSALLLAPVGLLGYHHAQMLSLGLNAAAVIVAAWLVLVLLQRRPTARAVAWSLLALGVSDAVGSTWANGNVNGVLVLVEVVTLLAMQRGRWVTAAVLLGLSLTIKPVLVPMLVLFIASRRWRPLVLCLAVPAVVTALGFAVLPDSGRFLGVTIPFLMHGAQLNFNDSLVGVGHLLAWPSSVVTTIRLIVAGATLALLTQRLRSPAAMSADEMCPLIGALLAVTFLVAPMSETYYTIYLMPALAAWALTSVRALTAATLTVAGFFATFRLGGEMGTAAPVSVPLALRPSIGWVVCAVAFGIMWRRLAAREASTPMPLSVPRSMRGYTAAQTSPRTATPLMTFNAASPSYRRGDSPLP